MGSAAELDLLGVVDARRWPERLLHVRFWGARVRGEWYQPTDRLMAFIERYARPL